VRDLANTNSQVILALEDGEDIKKAISYGLYSGVYFIGDHSDISLSPHWHSLIHAVIFVAPLYSANDNDKVKIERSMCYNFNSSI